MAILGVCGICSVNAARVGDVYYMRGKGHVRVLGNGVGVNLATGRRVRLRGTLVEV